MADIKKFILPNLAKKLQTLNFINEV